MKIKLIILDLSIIIYNYNNKLEKILYFFYLKIIYICLNK